MRMRKIGPRLRVRCLATGDPPPPKGTTHQILKLLEFSSEKAEFLSDYMRTNQRFSTLFDLGLSFYTTALRSYPKTAKTRAADLSAAAD